MYSQFMMHGQTNIKAGILSAARRCVQQSGGNSCCW